MIVVGIIAGVLYVTKLMVDYYWMGEDVRITLFHIKKTLPNVPSVRNSFKKFRELGPLMPDQTLIIRAQTKTFDLKMFFGKKLIKEKKYIEENFGITNKKEYAQ